MSNSISFLGNVGKDPELKKVAQTELLEFSVADTVGFGDRKSTNWFKCSIWGKRAPSLLPHIKKGSRVFVAGELSLKEYDKKDGTKGTSAEVRVDRLEFGGGSKGSGGGGQQGQGGDGDMPF